MKYFITLVMLLLCIQASAGQKITIKDVTFEVPDSFTQKQMEGVLLYASNEKSKSSIMLATVEIEDFDAGKVLEKMDTTVYNLGGDKLVDTEKENFYQWNKDYVKRYYRKSNGFQYISYTFYTWKHPYCFLFKYSTEEDLEQINQVIESIKIDDGLWGSLWQPGRQSPILLVIICVLLYLIAYFTHDSKNSSSTALKVSALLTLVLSAFLYLTGGGFSMCILVIAVVAFVSLFLVNLLKLEIDSD